MIIVMRSTAQPAEIGNVVRRLEQAGLKAHLSGGEERTVIGAIGRTFRRGSAITWKPWRGWSP